MSLNARQGFQIPTRPVSCTVSGSSCVRSINFIYHQRIQLLNSKQHLTMSKHINRIDRKREKFTVKLSKRQRMSKRLKSLSPMTIKITKGINETVLAGVSEDDDGSFRFLLAELSNDVHQISVFEINWCQ